jgi:hypothetical protein
MSGEGVRGFALEKRREEARAWRNLEVRVHPLWGLAITRKSERLNQLRLKAERGSES